MEVVWSPVAAGSAQYDTQWVGLTLFVLMPFKADDSCVGCGGAVMPLIASSRCLCTFFDIKQNYCLFPKDSHLQKQADVIADTWTKTGLLVVPAQERGKSLGRQKLYPCKIR